MAFDPTLAARLRALLAGRRGVTEKAMFGGLAFLLDGKMFCGLLGDELLARVGPDAHDAAIAREHVRIMDFTGRPMCGYVFVGPAALRRDAALAGWVEACAAHVATLPEKKARKPRKAASRRAASRRAAPRAVARAKRARPAPRKGSPGRRG